MRAGSERSLSMGSVPSGSVPLEVMPWVKPWQPVMMLVREGTQTGQSAYPRVKVTPSR